MKRLVGMLVVLLVVTLVATSAMAQTTRPPGTAAYVVQKGDTLWAKDGPTWERLLGPNTWLERRIMRYGPGRVLALIRPGEILCLPAGIVPADVVKSETPAAVVTPVVATPAVAPVVKTVTVEKAPWWSWWLLALLLFVPLVWFFLIRRYFKRRERELDQKATLNEREEQRRRAPEVAAEARRREEARVRERELMEDPVISGPPIVAGGIPATEPERLSAHFADWAVAECVRHYPGADVTRIVRVSPIEEGMISGEGMVGYADRARRRRINPPQPGYRARFRFPDDEEAVLMALVQCMNPCMYGEWLSGFVFTPGRIVVPVPESPTPVVAPEPAPVPVAEVAPAVAPSAPPAPVAVPEPIDDGVIRFELRKSTDDQPAMIRLTGIDERADTTCEVKEGSVTLRFVPRSK